MVTLMKGEHSQTTTRFKKHVESTTLDLVVVFKVSDQLMESKLET